MLHKYHDLLLKMIDRMSSLKGTNVTATDYWNVVLCEIQVIFLGLLYIALGFAVIVLPVLIFKYVYSEKIETCWTRHMKDVRLYNQKVDDYYTDAYTITNKQASRKDRVMAYDRIKIKLKEFNIPYEALNVDDISFKYIYESLPDIMHFDPYDDYAKLPGKYAVLVNPKPYKSYKHMYFVDRVYRHGLFAAFVVLYAVFVVPLILTLF